MEKLENIDKNIRSSFYGLSNNNVQKRIGAVQKILSILKQKQVGDEICSDMDYTLKRLVKGVASSHESARPGFTLLLTEILQTFPQISCSSVLELMETAFSSPENTELENHLGKTLVLTSILISKRYLPEDLSRIALNLNKLLQTKPYTKILVIKLYEMLFSQLSEENIEKFIFPSLKNKLSKLDVKCNPEILWLYLYFKENNSSLLKDVIDMDILTLSEEIASSLKQVTAYIPQLHPVSSALVKYVILNQEVKEQWKPLVEIPLLIEGELEKKYLGIQLVEAALDHVTKLSDLKIIVSPIFQKIFFSSLMNSKIILHKSATSFCENIISKVAKFENPKLFLFIVKMFLPYSSNVIIKKTLSKLVSGASLAMLPPLINDIMSTFNETESNSTRSLWINLIPIVLGHPKVTELDEEIKTSAIQFLGLHSFFEIQEVSEEILHCNVMPKDVDLPVRACCSQTLLKSIEVLGHHTKPQISLDLSVGHLRALTKYLLQLSESEGIVSHVKPVDQEILTQIKHDLHKLKKHPFQNSQLFDAIYLFLTLQLFLDPESRSDLVQDLHECFVRVRKEQESIEDEPDWSGVLVDILLALLSSDCHATRNFVNHLFMCYEPLRTAETLQQILDAIDPATLEHTKEDEESEEECEIEENGDNAEESDEEDDDSEDDDEESDEEDDADDTEEEMETDEIKVDDEALTDAEMFKMEKALAAAFVRSKSQTKQEKSQKLQSSIHFKLRCLDLLSSYFKHEACASHVMKVILPLCKAMIYGINHANLSILTEKSTTVLNNVKSIKKYSKIDVNKEEIHELFVGILELFKKGQNLKVAKVLSQIIMYVLHLENVRAAETNEKCSSFGKELKQALEEYMTTNYHQNFPTLLQKYFEVSHNKHGIKMLESVVEAAFSETKIFRKGKLLAIVKEALKHMRKNVPQDKLSHLVSTVTSKALEEVEKFPANTSYFNELVLLVALLLEDKDHKPTLTQPQKDKFKTMKKPKLLFVKKAYTSILKHCA